MNLKKNWKGIYE